MSRYVDLDTIHEPTANAYVPAAWGHQIRQNFDHMHRPYHFVAMRSEPYPGQPLLTNDANTEIPWDVVERHTGDFYPEGSTNVTTFVAPDDGFYVAHCRLNIESTYGAPFPSATSQLYVALMVIDDSNTNNYLLRSSTNLVTLSATLGGLVHLNAGTSFAFIAYQSTGADTYFSGECSIVYVGGNAP